MLRARGPSPYSPGPVLKKRARWMAFSGEPAIRSSERMVSAVMTVGVRVNSVFCAIPIVPPGG